jgi:prepilin-type N-terminal cleavage/methylation domain-containing protein
MKKGFTVIELLVVITIIGIFVGLSIPIFRSIGKESLSSNVYSFAQTLKSIRETAIIRNMEAQVIFDTIFIAPGGCEKPAYFVRYGNEPGKFFIRNFTFSPGNATLATPECGGGAPDPDGIQFPDNTLIFDPKGFARAGAIYISSQGETYGIGIAISGRIKVWKWGGGRWY